jgi:tetratricopeptide (TPR) repeat protein
VVDWAREHDLADAGEPALAGTLDLTRGTELDHFIVLDALGSGGMGVLVSAYDPNLDRKVAIKLVRPDGPAGSDANERRARLVREAHALAKLSHENVVTVYQAGTHGQHVYIAMELVHGGTLTTWLRKRRRTWREVVPMFLRVGRGLEAAHAAGFIHRDFKPENVLVGDDGRVRVTDFGLVGTAGAVSEAGGSDLYPALSSITRTGSLVGTPRYMAPEQHDAAPLDARADQFAFAVALHEALYGVQPFPGRGYAELAANVRAGAICAPPPDADVPSWLRRIVLRGLARRPDDRYPSMAALLEDLGRDPGRSRRRLAALTAIGGLLVGVALVTRSMGIEARPACTGAERTLSGVWDGETRARARAAFQATGAAYAEHAWSSAARRLDDYSVAWARMHRSVCMAAREGELSAAALDLRMACLGRRLEGLRALAGLLVAADEAVVEKAATAAAELESVDGCADLARLAASMPLPDDPSRRAVIAGARRMLAEAVARHEAGKYAEALPGVWTALALGRAAGYPPLEAEALYRLGRLQERLGDAPAAEESLFAATAAATRAGHIEVAADAQIDLVFVAGVIGAKVVVGRRAGEQGAALLTRLVGDRERRAKLLRYQGFLLDAEGRYREARARFLDALALEEELSDGPSYQLAGVLTAIFKNDHREGRYQEALPVARRALAVLEATLGPHHPFVGTGCTNLGAVLASLRRFPEALEQHRRALAIQEAALGPRHPEVALTLANIAAATASLGRHDESLAASERAIAISAGMPSPHEYVASFYQGLGNVQRTLRRFPEARSAYEKAVAFQEKTWGPEDVTLAEILHDSGHLLRLEGKTEQAYLTYRRAHAIFEKRLGEEHEETAGALASTGAALGALGRAAEGLGSVERARATLEKLLGPDHPSVGGAELSVGRLQRALGHRDLAIRAFEHAVAILQASDDDPLVRAEARLALATELWATRRERPRAASLAHEAQRDLEPLGPEADEDRRRVVAWLKHHRP